MSEHIASTLLFVIHGQVWWCIYVADCELAPSAKIQKFNLMTCPYLYFRDNSCKNLTFPPWCIWTTAAIIRSFLPVDLHWSSHQIAGSHHLNWNYCRKCVRALLLKLLSKFGAPKMVMSNRGVKLESSLFQSTKWVRSVFASISNMSKMCITTINTYYCW